MEPESRRSGGGTELLVAAVCMTALSAVVGSVVMMINKNHKAAGGAAIPGSFGLPIIGETLAFLQALRQNRAWEFVDERLTRASAESSSAGFFKTSLFGVPTAVMATAAGNKLAFANPHSSWPSGAVAIVGSHSIFAYEQPAAARRLRQAFASLLMSPEALRRYSPIMNATVRSFFLEFGERRRDFGEIRRHLGEIRRHFGEIRSHFGGGAKKDLLQSTKEEDLEICFLFPLLKSLAFSVACRLLLGHSRAADHRLLHPPFVSVMNGVFHLPVNLPGTPYNRAIRASREIRALIRGCIEEIRGANEASSFSASSFHGDDVLSRFLMYRDESGRPCSDEEIVDNILVLLIAGHDTTAATVAMTCKYLALNKAAMEAVYRENEEIRAMAETEDLGWEEVQKMKMSWRAVQESLRLQPPLHGSFRKLLEDTPFDRFILPKSWKIYWTTATHRNPTYFPHPENFDPSRFEGTGPLPFTFVPFGGGPRMCPGHEFARMEVLLIIHHFITRFSWTLKDPHEPISMDPVTFPVNGLPVLLKRR